MKLAAIGVHVLDTHVVGIESIPDGSGGQLVNDIRISAAGTAGGTALVARRLGADVSSFGAIGTDAAGDTLLSLLRAHGVNTDGLVRRADQPTSASVIPVRPNGDRPAWHLIGANGSLTVDDLPLVSLGGFSHVHLGGPEFLGGDAAAQVLAHAREAGAVTSVDMLSPGDPGILDWIAAALPHTDYLLPNDEQVLGLTGAPDLVSGARALVGAGAGCVALTQGARGALVVTADEVVEVPAFEVPVVDTTGCGDAFSAGFLRGLSLGRGLRAAAELGCATAAQVAGGLTTEAGSYDLDWVLAFAASAATLG